MRIVITNATGDAGAAAARSLRLAGFDVYAIDARRVPRFLASRHLRGYACIDDDDPLRRQDAFLRFIERTRADVFLPLCTPGAVFAVQRRRELESLCRIIAPDVDGFLAAYDKRRCMELCASLGIPCAGRVTRDAALALLHDDGPRRVVVKPAIDVGAASGIEHVTNAGGLDAAIDRCASRYGHYLIQEYVPGNAAAMHTVSVVLSGTGRLAAAFTARKLRHWPATGGITACGVSTREQSLVDLVLPFFGHCRWRGPAEVELKRDDRDGAFKVIEINPRFPGYLRLPIVCGATLAVVAARAALGDEPAGELRLSEYRDGVTYVAPTVFAQSIVAEARERGWGATLSRARAETAGAWPMLRSLLSDPLPIVTRSVVPKRSYAAAPFRGEWMTGATLADETAAGW